MSRFARLLTCCGALALAAFVAASSLINDEAMNTYRRAIEEKHKPKATALLRGLLLSSVSVGVDASTIPGDDYDWEDGVSKGIDVWSEALDDSPFVLAKRGEKPDVIVKFVRRIEDSDHAQGLIKAQRHFYWQGSQAGGRVTGTIYVRTDVGRRWISGDEVSRVISHELGHLLGLDDDRKGTGVMGDFIAGRGRKGPSQSELDSVFEFRQMLRQALKDTASKPQN
jgi:hypothetical protein